MRLGIYVVLQAKFLIFERYYKLSLSKSTLFAVLWVDLPLPPDILKRLTCSFIENWEQNQSTWGSHFTKKVSPSLRKTKINLGYLERNAYLCSIVSKLNYRMYKLLSMLFALALFTSMGMQAQNAGQPAAQTRVAAPNTIYVFGVSQSLSDSVVYVSGVTEITGHTLGAKGFLLNRSHYSAQLHDYLLKQGAAPHQTTAVFFEKTSKKAFKRLSKVKQRLAKPRAGLPGLTIREVTNHEFRFQLPTP